MIIKLIYNKNTKQITMTDDEEVMEATVSEVVDTDDELSFEISLNTSAYQSQFDEEIELADGNDN
tara:strand:- start:133 stop:327 length:195 start_codon:yes stop_codon:yes gene_type:complete